MKNFISSLLITFLFFIACEEEQIQRNEIIDKYIQNNKKQLNEIEREVLITYPRDMQKQIMRSFTSKKKYKLWMDKFTHELNSAFWSKDEKFMIIELYNTITPQCFSDTDAKQHVIEFYKLWRDKVMRDHGWSKYKVGVLTHTLYPADNFKRYFNKDYEVSYESLGLKDLGMGTPDPDCDCNWGWTCSCNNLTECEETDEDCGFLGLQGCDGLCR